MGGMGRRNFRVELVLLRSLARFIRAVGLGRKHWLIFLNHIPNIIDPFPLESYSTMCSLYGG